MVSASSRVDMHLGSNSPCHAVAAQRKLTHLMKR